MPDLIEPSEFQFNFMCRQFVHHRERVVDFVVGRVEVRRHADAGVRTMVDDHVAGDEVGGNARAVGDVDGHRAAAPGILLRRTQPPAPRERVVDDATRLPQ